MTGASLHLGDAAMAAALRRAIDDDRLVVHYQPKHDLFRRKVTGVEALVRWPGGASPARFIPVAERAGMIGALGRWVLEQSCHQAALWRARGFELSVAVNVSPLQLAAGGALERVVAAALADSGLPARLLELEVTEGVLMDEGACATLGRLKTLGVSIALDDFGSGYSSLAYLRHLGASTLKIDKSFVDGLPAALDDCMLVRAVIGLAHSFGMAVVAEGVETRDQQEVLELLGCDMIQGYVLSPAIPADALLALLERTP